MELSDALGIRVYAEAWRTHLPYFVSRVTKTLGQTLSISPSDQVVPSLAQPLGLQWGQIQQGLIQLTPPPGSNIYGVGYYNPSGRVRLDGAVFFGWLQPVGSSRWLYLLITAAGLFGVWFGATRPDWREMVAIVVTLGLFVVASAVMIGLRIKEVATLTPLYFALVAVGLNQVFRLIGPARWIRGGGDVRARLSLHLKINIAHESGMGRRSRSH